MQSNKFSRELLEKIELKTKANFTTCLLNLYRDRSDRNGWHVDNEKELGLNPIIASVITGQGRYFHLKHRIRKGLKHKILLEHGNLLLMNGETLNHWLHQIPKRAKAIQERQPYI